jgi:cytochrome c oxidase subunit 3
MTSAAITPGSPTLRRQIAPNAVLGISIFVITESMLFAGLVSAHTIVKMGTIGVWPPVGQPRLPAGETLFNTAALLLSGALLAVGLRVYKKQKSRALPFVLWSGLLGAVFMALQGREWAMMLSQGLTLTSSTHGGFFYLIVGVHALHALAGLIALFFLYSTMKKGEETAGQLGATAIYWGFVVLLWPILYLKVYL